MESIGRMLALAKLNLILRVEGRRGDGFHQLRMLNVPLAFADEVSICKGDGDSDRLEVSFPNSLPGRFTAEDRAALSVPEKNSCMVAVARFRERIALPYPVSIELRKQIPATAGLGGGSSDAAVVLRILGAKANAASEILHSIAASVGSDVPYFLAPSAAEVAGVGERIHLIPDHPLRGREVYLFFPPFGCSTPAVYSEFRRHHPNLMPTRQPDALLPAPQSWTDGDQLTPSFIRLLGNDLSSAAISVRPELSGISAAVGEIPDSYGAITGSGSTVFALPVSTARFSTAQRAAAMHAAQCSGCVGILTQIL